MTVTRRQVWMVSFDENRVGREQEGQRPALVISDDIYNNGPSEKVIVLPITSRETGIPYHIEVPPKEGSLKKKSFIVCDQIQSISQKRLVEPWGTVSQNTMAKVEEILSALIFAPH
jgi:mRNA interferase MazF